MRNAERYLTQGKIHAAISEYKQIVENEPKDINSRNMLGDLYIKANDNQAAVNCYKEVAEHYNSQGFAKKAISIYNKIYRIEPDSMEISLKLADLYQTRGSMAEAQKHYEDIAKRYEEKGRKIEALAIWEKIAEISPRDTEIYIKIADAYWQEDRKSEAAEAFIQAGSRFYEAERFQSAATAYQRSLEVNAEDFFALRGYVKSQIKLGYPEEGAKLLEEKLESQPFNKELNYLLMDCYFDMADPKRAEDLIVKLIEREPANYAKLLDLVRVYLENNDLESAVRVLTMTSEHMLVAGEVEELFELLNEVLNRNPEQIAALRLLTRIHGWQRDELELQKALERLIEAANLQEATEDERYALAQYILLAPHDVERANRLKEINELYGFDDGLQNEESLLQSTSSEIPTFESFANLSKDEPASENEFQVVDESNILVADSLNEKNEENFSENGYRVQVVEENVGSKELTENEPAGKSNVEARSGQEVLSAADEMRISEEIEGIKFYIDQGYAGLADKALTDLEKEFGNRPEIVELREQLSGTNKTSAASQFDPNIKVSEVESSELPDVNTNKVETESPEAEEEIIVAREITEISQVERNGFEMPASVEADPTKEPETQQTEAEVEQTEVVDDENTNKEKHEHFNLMDELGLSESESDEVDDYDEHYQHAIVYQEMGMLEEALREFQDAVACVEADDGTRRFLNCCTLIGHCFMQKEMANLALKWFERAFETPDLTVEEKQGVYYEIGSAYEALGDAEKAFEKFELIYAVDVDYRDVRKRLEDLREKIPTPA